LVLIVEADNAFLRGACPTRFAVREYVHLLHDFFNTLVFFFYEALGTQACMENRRRKGSLAQDVKLCTHGNCRDTLPPVAIAR
jgi:hypothetical protein